MHSPSNLGEKFDYIVNLYSEKIAIYYPEENLQFSYSELNKISNACCGFLNYKKVKKDSVVAIFNDKSIYGYSIIIACLKLGIPYVNLDETSPSSRLEKIIDIISPKLIINLFEIEAVDKSFRKKLDQLFIHKDEFTNYLNHTNYVIKKNKVISTNPAYIMFTSGSTGFPKGVTISHGNILNFISWCKDEFQITYSDRITNLNPLFFDNSVFDIYNSLFNGACLIPFNKEQTKNPMRLVYLLEKGMASVYFSVPSLLIYLISMKTIKDDSLKSLKKVIFGGEGFPKNKLKILYDIFGNRADLFNVYGPTECTCICSSHKIVKDDFSNMSSLTTLGKLAPMFDFQIINKKNDIGELVLYGDNVGKGYFNNFQKTKEVFIQNPKHNNFIDIGYKTGDLVKLGKNSNFYFKGRKDYQIKYLGYRIELGEIEAIANLIKEVCEAAVVFQKTRFSDGQIVLYVSLLDQMDSIFIRNFLKKNLPDYMIPKKIIQLKELPKNANGKIDRKQLINLK